MIEPLPNCFSIALTASEIARSRSPREVGFSRTALISKYLLGIIVIVVTVVCFIITIESSSVGSASSMRGFSSLDVENAAFSSARRTFNS